MAFVELALLGMFIWTLVAGAFLLIGGCVFAVIYHFIISHEKEKGYGTDRLHG